MNRMKKFMALFLAVVLIAQTGFAASAQESALSAPSVQSETPAETELQDETGMTEQQPEDSKDETTGETTETGQDGEDAAVGEVDGEQPGNPSEGTGTEEDGQAPPADHDQNQDQNQEQDQNQNQGQDQEQQQPSNAAGDGEGTEVGEPTEEEKTEADGTEALDASDALLEEELETLSALDENTTIIYVNDDGQEEVAAGTEENPYVTIEDALNALADIKISDGAPNPETKDVEYTIMVMPGTYARFEVPQHMLNVTIQGVSDENGDKPVIQTLMENDTLDFGTMDTGGVRVGGAGSITFDNLKFETGTNTDYPFFPATIQDQDGNYGITYENEPITVQNCEFDGPGKEYKGVYGVAMARNTWSVKDCTFTGYHNAIEMMADNNYVGHVEVTGNTITDCEFGVHGYYGMQMAQDMETYDNIFVLENNVFEGDSSQNWAMINTLSSYNGNSTMKVQVQGNTFASAMMSTLDVLDEYVLVDIEANNTWNEKSYLVDAHYFIDTGETSVKWYSTYSGADDEEGYTRSQWVLSGDTEYGTEAQREAIKNWLESEDHQWDNPMEVAIPSEDGNGVESFTSAKKFIQRVERPAGNLTVRKTVNSANEADKAKEFNFRVELSYPTATEDGIDYDVNGTYYKEFADSVEFTVVKSDGTEQTIVNGGQVSISDGESFTVKNIPAGSKYTVTELGAGKYDVTVDGVASTISEGTISSSEDTETEFVNTQKQTEWDTSKSKTATNLDSNYESQVTLSLPAADVKPAVDIVMVIDVSSSMKDVDIQEVKNAANVLCDQLAEKTNVETNIGIVTFDKTAHKLTDGLVSVDAAREAINSITASEDTNMVAGLMAGKEMLDAGTAAEKHLVVMSDGIPIYWMENGEVTSKTLISYAKDGVTELGRMPAGTEPEGSNNAMTVMSMEEILSATDWATDSNEWKQISDTGENINQDECRYTNIQKASYMTAKYLQDNILGQYNVKMVAFGTDKYEGNIVYQYGENFCDWVGEQEGVSYYKISKPGFGGEEGELSNVFESIANEVIHLLDAGSRVEDYMGYVENDYNFDFVNELDKIKLTVGGAELPAVQIDSNTYGFGASNGSSDGKTYPFVVTYVKGNGAEEEHFVWNINVPVTIDSAVQLTYTVRLNNPKTETGSYGKYDKDGSQGYEGLYTNNSATLFPVDSKGNEGASEEFNKPTVSYTVADHPATINITKKVQNSSGAATNVNATFYAAVFTDPQFTNRFGDVVELKLNGTSQVTVSVTVEAPADGSSRSYYVTETDKNGNVITGGESFGYQIGIEGSMVTVSESAPTGSVTITNKQVASGNQGGGSNGGGSTGGGSSSGSGSSSSQTVTSAQTGDNTNLLLPIAVVVIAAAALTVCLVVYRRKRS